MSEQCEWKIRYSDTKRWQECEAQTAFDDRFCPAHQEIALANEIPTSSPLDLLATALLPIVEAFTDGRITLVPNEIKHGTPEAGFRTIEGYKFLVAPRGDVEA